VRPCPGSGQRTCVFPDVNGLFREVLERPFSGSSRGVTGPVP
jgi:hypothetical protein